MVCSAPRHTQQVKPMKLTTAQTKLLKSLRAQKLAAIKEPGARFSNGWTLGSAGCHRSVAAALLKKGLVTYEKDRANWIVCIKD